MSEPFEDLTPEEEVRGVALALARHRRSEALGHVNRRFSAGRPPEHYHVLGVLCEMAVAKRLRVPISDDIPGYQHIGNNDDVAGWQIKGTDHPRGRLLLPVRYAQHYELRRRYLLVRKVGRRYFLVGWAWGYEFIGREDCIVDEPKYGIHAYCPKVLHPFEPEPEDS
jgi:hypothetical protein